MKVQGMRNNKMIVWMMVFAMVLLSINLTAFTLHVNAEGTEVKVTFRPDGGKIRTEEGEKEYTENVVKCGEEYGVLPKAVKVGFIFDGWYTSIKSAVEKEKTYEMIKATTKVKSATDHKLYAHWVRFEIKCQDITYGETFKPEMLDNKGQELVWYYMAEDIKGNYSEFNPENDPEDRHPNAGKYSFYAEIKETGDRSDTITVSVNKAIPKYNKPQSQDVHALCGDRLTDVSLDVENENGHFEWEDSEKVIKEGDNEEYVKFIPDDSKNYKEVEKIPVQFKAAHDIKKESYFEHENEADPVEPKVDKKGKEVEKGKAGYRESYQCKTCGKVFDAKGQEHDASWFVKPCYVKQLTVELKEKNNRYGLEDLVKDGIEGIDIKNTEFKNTKYLKFDKDTGTITTGTIANLKNYGKSVKPQTITFKDKAGDSQTVTIDVMIASPTVVKANKKFSKNTQGIQIKRKKAKSPSGLDGYLYTIKYNVKDAKSLKITASGLKDKNTQKELDKLLVKRIKKSKGTYTFGVVKKDIKKKKITFEVVVDYGNGNKSKSISITE